LRQNTANRNISHKSGSAGLICFTEFG